MISSGWWVCSTRRDLALPSSPLPFVNELPEDLSGWLDAAGVAEGTPFLLSPLWEYDVALNGFFRGVLMAVASRTTAVGDAFDLAKFLTFLWECRGGRSGR